MSRTVSNQSKTLIAYSLFVFVLSVIPTGGGGLNIPFIDKGIHVILYIPLALFAIGAFSKSKQRYRYSFLYATGFGFLLELIQHFLPYRSFQLADVVANSVGALIGIYAYGRYVRPCLYSRHETLVALLKESAARFKQKEAIVFGRKKVSYATLDQITDKLASGFHSMGLGLEQKACIWLPNCPEFVYSYFAILKLGACAVPINSMFKREEAKFVLADSGARILVCSIDKLDDAKVILTRVESLEHIVCVASCKKDHCANINELIHKSVPLKRHPPINPDSFAEILYTSGTTGSPKGACLTHKNLVTNVRDCALAINATEKDTFICFLPLFHSFASTVCMLLPLYVGAKTVIMRTIRPFKRVLRAVIKNKVTIFVGVPSLFNILANTKIKPFKLLMSQLFNPVRLYISGAAALPNETLAAFQSKFKRILIEGYGLTEASPVVSLNPLKGRRIAGSVGLSLPSLEVNVVDEKGAVLKRNEIGELIIKGPSIMKGYYNLPKETEKTIRGGWLYTGDLAKIDKDNYIYIIDRVKDMINVRGLNVYPKEIEELLYRHPAVAEASVVGAYHRHRGEVPVAFVVAQTRISARELIRYLRSNLASYKVPLKIIFKEALPKNTTGKILKRELRKEVADIFRLNRTFSV